MSDVQLAPTKPVLQARITDEQDRRVEAYLYVTGGKRTQLVLDSVMSKIDSAIETDPELAKSMEQALGARRS